MEHDVIHKIIGLFGSLDSLRETAGTCRIILSTLSQCLPQPNALLDLINTIPDRDELNISMEGMIETSFTYWNHENWIQDYDEFRQEQDIDESIKIEIMIQKRCAEDRISIYDFNAFMDFLCSQTLAEQIKVFSSLVEDIKSYLRFDVLSGNEKIYTKYFAFCKQDTTWPCDETSDRKVDIAKCTDASTFLNRNQISLLPQDFDILSADAANSIINIMQRLQTILSYIYMANTSHIVNDKLVLYFNTDKPFEVNINDIVANDIICKIYKWAYGGDTAVERAAIARNIIMLHCKTVDELLSITDDVFSSIKSNYVIYQKDTSQQYIDTKNRIAEYIVENAHQLQELAFGLVEGLRNNFIAVITFFITVVLTDSVDKEMLHSNGLPRNLFFISVIIIIASILYLILTHITTGVKLKMMREQYVHLKNNYKDVLDEKDLEIAFSKDEVHEKSIHYIKMYRWIVSILWVIFIACMCIGIAIIKDPLPNKSFSVVEILRIKIQWFFDLFKTCA